MCLLVPANSKITSLVSAFHRHSHQSLRLHSLVSGHVWVIDETHRRKGSFLEVVLCEFHSFICFPAASAAQPPSHDRRDYPNYSSPNPSIPKAACLSATMHVNYHLSEKWPVLSEKCNFETRFFDKLINTSILSQFFVTFFPYDWGLRLMFLDESFVHYLFPGWCRYSVPGFNSVGAQQMIQMA